MAVSTAIINYTHDVPREQNAILLPILHYFKPMRFYSPRISVQIPIFCLHFCSLQDRLDTFLDEAESNRGRSMSVSRCGSPSVLLLNHAFSPLARRTTQFTQRKIESLRKLTFYPTPNPPSRKSIHKACTHRNRAENAVVLPGTNCCSS
jgi:hypothetical protein